jgi:hypothetical protein
MRGIKYVLTAAAAVFFLAAAPQSHAQVSVGINIGPAPACPYGYYDYAPYNCAPYGYYGPEWFNGGVFIGAGKWFRGPANFHGNVNNSFDPKHGYKGALPGHGPAQVHPDNFKSFKGNEARDGRGHTR